MENFGLEKYQNLINLERCLKRAIKEQEDSNIRMVKRLNSIPESKYEAELQNMANQVFTSIRKLNSYVPPKPPKSGHSDSHSRPPSTAPILQTEADTISPISSASSSGTNSPVIFEKLLSIVDMTESSMLSAKARPSSHSSQSQRVVHTRKTPENRVRTVRELALNPIDGSFKINAKFGAVTVLSVGDIEFDDASFHTERYIYPPGYKISRKFLSYLNAQEDEADYICEILKTSIGPVFTAQMKGDEKVFEGRSASGAWTQIITQAYEIRQKQPSTAICGPDLFGFTLPEVAKAIQELPNANLCQRYKWQQFVLKRANKKRGQKLSTE